MLLTLKAMTYIHPIKIGNQKLESIGEKLSWSSQAICKTESDRLATIEKNLDKMLLSVPWLWCAAFSIHWPIIILMVCMQVQLEFHFKFSVWQTPGSKTLSNSPKTGNYYCLFTRRLLGLFTYFLKYVTHLWRFSWYVMNCHLFSFPGRQLARLVTRGSLISILASEKTTPWASQDILGYPCHGV